MARIPSIFSTFDLADGLATGVACAPVTVGDAFRQTLDALMKARGWRGVDLTAATGLSSATVTKLKNGERGASFAVLERVRAAFGVSPAGLFDADAALAHLGLKRQDSDANRGRNDTLVSNADTPVGSAFPSSLVEGGLVVFQSHPDSELLSALLSYWDALTPERRLELVGHGMRLRAQSKADTVVTPTAGFGRG
jgi:transcriptional regulator with XRE-family HTH domain